MLGLKNARTIIQGAIASLPPRLAARGRRSSRSASFANLAIQGLGFASPVLGSIGTPLTVDETQLAGQTTPTDTYAAAIAVIVSLMFVTRAAGGRDARARALGERLRAAGPRARSRPTGLLSEKIALAAGCAGAGDAC